EFHRAGHRPDTVPARWSAQLGNDGGPVPPGLRIGAELDRWTFFEALVQVVAALVDLPRIELLLPPPSQWTRRTTRLRAGVADRGALDRIRALLAKAEATTFLQEAEILTDKAQELMAKYAVDEVLVGTAEPAATEIVGRRVGLDEPCADEKATLAAVCASAQRCRAVHDPRLGHVTLLGTPGDVE